MDQEKITLVSQITSLCQYIPSVVDKRGRVDAVVTGFTPTI